MASESSSQLDLLRIGKAGSGKSRTGNTIVGKEASRVSFNSEHGTSTVDLDEGLHNGTLIKTKASERSSQLDLLLIGKAGSGKSRTGNTIVGKEAFRVSFNSEHGTSTVDLDEGKHNGTLIKVVDVPGMLDTRRSQEEGMDFFKLIIKDAMLLNPEGFDGFLFVLRYGSRFTDEDVSIVKFLKEMFGPDSLKDMCILILTGGDNFEADHKDEGVTFEQWCLRERGNFRKLIEECGERILLFDNKTKVETKKTDQIDKLLSLVENLKKRNKNKKYTDMNFEKAKALKSEDFNKQEKLLKKVDLLLEKLQKVEGKYNQYKLLQLSSDCAQVLLTIQEIKQKLEELKTSVDKGYLLYSLNSDKINRKEERAMEEKRDAIEEIDTKIRELDCICPKYRNGLNNFILPCVVSFFAGVLATLIMKRELSLLTTVLRHIGLAWSMFHI